MSIFSGGGLSQFGTMKPKRMIVQKEIQGGNKDINSVTKRFNLRTVDLLWTCSLSGYNELKPK